MGNGQKVFKYGCIGCGIFILLIFIVLGGGIGYISYQGYQFGKEIGETYKTMVADYENYDKQFAYTPPADGLLIEERLETFLNVRSKLADFAKEYLEKIEKTGENIGKQFEESGFLSKLKGISGIKEIAGMTAKMGANIGEEHIRLLKEQTMSIGEYRWLTLNYLGTLSKAKENHFEPGEKRWEEYLTAFDSARNKYQGFNVNFGKGEIKGEQMNRENLVEKLTPVSYLTPNAEIINRTWEHSIPNDYMSIMDFLTLYYDELVKQMSTK